VPAGSVTEVVGPPGMGKTQLCLQAALLTALPESLGGRASAVVYFDTENKFSAERMLEMASHRAGLHDLTPLADRVIVTTTRSAAELTDRLRQLSSAVIDRGVRLVVVDSIASHMRADFGPESVAQRQALLAEQAGLLKRLADSFRVPVLVTNQITVASRGAATHGVPGPAGAPGGNGESDGESDGAGAGAVGGGRMVAALGPLWAHAVNTRIALLARHGRRWAELCKSPCCPNVAVPYKVGPEGVSPDPGAQPEYVPAGSVLELPMDDEARQLAGHAMH